jgi:hypothetical protein
MTDDGFVIIESTIRPKPKPQPLIAPDPGRTYGDLSPAQKARVARRQNGPLFFEPLYSAAGPTGRWRVGRLIGSEEKTIAEYDIKNEALACFRRLVDDFWR